MSSDTIDNDVFSRMAEGWWDENSFLNAVRWCLNPWRLFYLRRILARLKIEPHGQRLLDIGCGGGLLTEELAALGFVVSGLDPSERSIEVAQVHALQTGVRVDYRVGPGDQLPFDDGTFGLVCCCDVLEHIPNWEAVIHESARVLKPGGVFFYDTLNRTAASKFFVIKAAQEWSLTRFLPPHLHVWEMFIRPAELKTALDRHGLENQAFIGGTPVSHPIRSLIAIRQYKKGRITAAELGRRTQYRETADLSVSYAGYAIKRGPIL